MNNVGKEEAVLEGIAEACASAENDRDFDRAKSWAEYGSMPNEVMHRIADSVLLNIGNYADVREFQQKFGQLVGDKPRHLTKRKLLERIAQMQEELDEFKAAVEADDIAEQADALIDIVYFAMGTANHMGLPWQALWNDVHRANMSKEPGVKPERGFLVDCIKPEGWEGPKTMDILLAHGYQAPSCDADYADDEIHKGQNNA